MRQGSRGGRSQEGREHGNTLVQGVIDRTEPMRSHGWHKLLLPGSLLTSYALRCVWIYTECGGDGHQFY